MADLKIFTSNIEADALKQIDLLLKQDAFTNSKIRIMPDVHVGKGCVIGFTGTLGDQLIPNIVGVDIGCGILTLKLHTPNLNLVRLDQVINKYIPSGFSVHNEKKVKHTQIKQLRCYNNLKNTKRLEQSIGTLGGGNHFIEVGKDNQDNVYLMIHTGSRNLGKQVAEYYQSLAFKQYQTNRSQNHNIKEIPKDLTYLEGKSKADYLHDMDICQKFASLNRHTIAEIICQHLTDITIIESFETIHNYIDIKSNIIRKGAISAKKDELLLIPINMRDGSILAKGKGNPDWNYSAPHGAGRVMSRSQARKKLSLEDFRKSMSGIYTTSVNKDTIDEAPIVYKPIQEIIDHIGDAVEIIAVIKPIYNFKASE